MKYTIVCIAPDSSSVVVVVVVASTRGYSLQRQFHVAADTARRIGTNIFPQCVQMLAVGTNDLWSLLRTPPTLQTLQWAIHAAFACVARLPAWEALDMRRPLPLMVGMLLPERFFVHLLPHCASVCSSRCGPTAFTGLL